MITKTKVIKSVQNFVKVWRFGKEDIIEPLPVLPYGVDSKPAKGDTGVVCDTASVEAGVIIGYIKRFDETLEGEVRLYAADGNGNEVGEIFLKRNGDIYLNGSTDNAVRYSELQVAFDQLKSDFNILVAAYNLHVHPVPLASGVAVPPAVGATTATASSGTPSVANIAPAKVGNVKIN